MTDPGANAVLGESGPPAPAATPPSRRRWPRMSLRAWLVMIVIVTLVISNLATAFHSLRAQYQLLQLRHEVGGLTVWNSRKFFAAGVPNTASNLHQFRVYVPPGGTYSVYFLQGMIGPEGFGPFVRGESPEDIATQLAPGEYFISLTLVEGAEPAAELFVRQSESDTWRLGTHVTTSRRVLLTDVVAKSLFANPYGTGFGSLTSAGEIPRSPERPLQLLRLLGNSAGSRTYPPHQALHGILLWVCKDKTSP